MKNTSPAKEKLTDAERHKRFVEMAKEVDASEEAKAFDKAIERVDLRHKADEIGKPLKKS
jgi:hypothetical protein